MKQTLRRLLGCGMVLAGLSGAAQAAPANDNFGNRISLAGESVSFSGTIYQGTYEAGDPTANRWIGAIGGGGSSWWSWTAPLTGFAVVTMPQGAARTFLWGTELVVYRGGGAAEVSGLGTLLGWMPVERGMDMAFNVTAGEVYALALAGDASTNLTQSFHLEAGARPIFLTHPLAQTVRNGDSVFLGAVSPGLKSGELQWQLNGQDLPGAVTPTLALNNVSATNAGDYRLLARRLNNESALVISTGQVARLTVEGVEVRPTLQLHRRVSAEGRFALDLTGEVNQGYVVHQTTDFTNWFPLLRVGKYAVEAGTEFPLRDIDLLYLDPANAPGLLAFRVARLGDLKQWCVANLRRLEFAKERSKVDRRRFEGGVPVPDEVDEYLDLSSPHLFCPAGGTYTYGSFNVNPQCSIVGHTL